MHNLVRFIPIISMIIAKLSFVLSVMFMGNGLAYLLTGHDLVFKTFIISATMLGIYHILADLNNNSASSKKISLSIEVKRVQMNILHYLKQEKHTQESLMALIASINFLKMIAAVDEKTGLIYPVLHRKTRDIVMAIDYKVSVADLIEVLEKPLDAYVAETVEFIQNGKDF